MLEVPDRIRGLLSEEQNLRQQLAQLETDGGPNVDDALKSAEQVQGVTLVVAELPGRHPDQMRQFIDQLRQKTASSAVLLASTDQESRVTLIAGMSRDLVERGLNAGNWVKEVAPLVGGGGGGRPDLAQAGGKHPEKLPAAMQRAREWIRNAIGNLKT
jgi:alanyl-tRNA synthetase